MLRFSSKLWPSPHWGHGPQRPHWDESKLQGRQGLQSRRKSLTVPLVPTEFRTGNWIWQPAQKVRLTRWRTFILTSSNYSCNYSSICKPILISIPISYSIFYLFESLFLGSLRIFYRQFFMFFFHPSKFSGSCQHCTIKHTEFLDLILQPAK